jgi:hypothetical protein
MIGCLAGVFLLVSCSEGGVRDVRSTALTPELLEDQQELQRIGNRLEPEDRPVFARYVMYRMMAGSTPGVVPILEADGSDPDTVAEALDAARRIMALEAARDAKMAAAAKKMDDAAAAPNADTPQGIAAYNEAVAEHNAAMEEFSVKAGLTKGP